MYKTMFVALLGLTLAGCVESDDPAESEVLLEEESPPGPSDDEDGCADPSHFDLVVFGNEIGPTLTGAIDWNDPLGEPTTGCTRGPCHGTPRPGGFDLTGSAQEQLERFACFVDLERPRRSQILLCGLDDDGCAASPHPGGAAFTGTRDLNYQRILDYIRASRP